MVRGKRGYTPKIKGCFQCAQRRINCDGNLPSCNKCVSRNLECSGAGSRFRFRENTTPTSVSTRNKDDIRWPYVLPDHIPTDSLTASRPRYSAFNKSPTDVQAFGVWDSTTLDYHDEELLNTWPQERVASIPNSNLRQFTSSPRQDSVQEPAFTLSESPTWDSSAIFDSDSMGNTLMEYCPIPSPDAETNLSQCSPRSEIESSRSLSPYISPIEMTIAPSLKMTDSASEYLLQYFADYIAPEMVLMDGTSNRWRNLVLPIAMSDSLIMNAVLTASAFHLSGRLKMLVLRDPNELYVRTLSGLRNCDIARCDIESRHRSILAILLLLICVMVTGSSDFPMLFRTLENAIVATGGQEMLEKDEEISRFIRSQIQMMRIHATPLLSTSEGVLTVASPSNRHFATRQYYNDLYATRDPMFDIVADLRQQSFDVYLDRVINKDKAVIAKHQVEGFINGLRSLCDSTLGAQVLTWSCFIVATESSEPGQKTFFENFLMCQYERNGFANNLRALDLLRKIWSSGSRKPWPEILLGSHVFIF